MTIKIKFTVNVNVQQLFTAVFFSTEKSVI